MCLLIKKLQDLINKLLFITVNYKNTEVTNNFVQSFESLQHSDQASIIIVDNDSTPESKIALNKIVKNSNVDIKIIISPKNLYYWGAANYVLDQIDLNVNNHPEWIIICNNDIKSYHH